MKLHRERKSESNIRAKTWNHSSLKNVKKWTLKSFSSEPEFSTVYEHSTTPWLIWPQLLPLFPPSLLSIKKHGSIQATFSWYLCEVTSGWIGQRKGLIGPSVISDTAAATRLASSVSCSNEDLGSLVLEEILPSLFPPA